MGHQSLYRRYRSQNFAEIIGQGHVTKALQTAVKEGRHGHAYLFSGPRGTGKTSTARVLAKALNCENLNDGEPCKECKSCLAIEHGTSFDLHELDAASNNKVDDIRDLIAKVALGSPGRTKVYILDEVHMLSAGAENALLKTLEEPPDHVVFVLATTEPHKVVPTIRSRTQLFDFRLIGSEDLAAHVRYVIDDAGLDVDDAGVEYVIRKGGGSARDTLSALDQIAASGGVPPGSEVGHELAMAIGDKDPAATISIIQRALEAGREPRIIGEMTLEVLRNAFLASMEAPSDQLSEAARESAQTLAIALGPATITRSLESLGQALVEMRQAPDPRVPLEVTMLRLARGSGHDPAILLQRIEALESKLEELIASGPQTSSGESKSSTHPPSEEKPAAPRSAAPRSAAPRSAAPRSAAPRSAAPRSNRPEPPRPSSVNAKPEIKPSPAQPTENQPAAVQQQAETQKPGAALDLASLQAQSQEILAGVTQKVRSKFRLASISGVDGDTIIFGLPNTFGLERCQAVQDEMAVALSDRFGRAISVKLILEDGSGSSNAGPPATASTQSSAQVQDSASKAIVTPNSSSDSSANDEAEIGDVSELDDAPDVASTGIDRITEAFPGATVVEPSD